MYDKIDDYYGQSAKIAKLFNLFIKALRDFYFSEISKVQVTTIIAAKRIFDELQYIAQEIKAIGYYSCLDLGENNFENDIDLLIQQKCQSWIQQK